MINITRTYETNLLFHQVFLFQDLVDLARGRRTLKLLPVQQLVLQLLDGLNTEMLGLTSLK